MWHSLPCVLKRISARFETYHMLVEAFYIIFSWPGQIHSPKNGNKFSMYKPLELQFFFGGEQLKHPTESWESNACNTSKKAARGYKNPEIMKIYQQSSQEGGSVYRMIFRPNILNCAKTVICPQRFGTHPCIPKIKYILDNYYVPRPYWDIQNC